MVSTPIIKGSEAKALPYLQACILEGLRTFPPLAQLREREVPPEGDVINGFHIPGGTFIGLNMWGTQLDPVFGEDPEVFRPERWMIDDAEKLKEMHNTQGLIFSYGSTKCLGMTLATMEISKMVFEVRTFFFFSFCRFLLLLLSFLSFEQLVYRWTTTDAGCSSFSAIST